MEITEFLAKSYTCYHAAELCVTMLKEAGFEPLGASSDKAKGVYRVTGGSVFAARAGSGKINIALSHTDSPSLRVRYAPGACDAALDTEKYGGGLLRSYFDRKMKIAGRVVVRGDGGLAAKTVCSDFDVVIPSLAVHLGAGKEGEAITVSRDMRPFTGECGDLYAALGYADAVDADLYCVPACEPFYIGTDGGYLCSPRIDDLVSVYASVRAIINCDNKATAVTACFNNEETGSETREGAQSALLSEFIFDAFAAFGKPLTQKDITEAFALSCDGAHALHPSRKEVYVSGAPVTGGGVVIKRNDRYATDALTSAAAREIFARAGLKTQLYYHHPDMRCGSTIGLTVAHTLGCNVCDMGVAQLGMHSASETAAVCDIEDLQKGLTAFFGCEVEISGDAVKIY